ncbi:MAG: phosphoribosylaminoimidazolesuccinocarboxamide synthase [Candidatus Moranbacteria bacterium]|nr:phosphoribosylaminoimidazolesuccinocarboxamide synthase [Candidatus Moranbacteria bacterium]
MDENIVVVAKGKTKTLYELPDRPGVVLVRSGNEITKNDDPDATKLMESKALHATSTTCAIFSLLKAAGIPVAFLERTSPTEFLAPKCKMIQLEVIMRRYAPLKSSYIMRRPDLERAAGELPHRFHRLMFELFLKTTSGEIRNRYGEVVGKMPNDCLEIERKKPVDDPLLVDCADGIWELRHPKIPSWDDRSKFDMHINMGDVLPNSVTVEMIEELARKTFLVLEGAWSQLGCRLIDFKIEFGLGPNGELLVADVIDNDSWRLRDSNWQELSKQLFRDNADMSQIADKYALVANLTSRLTIPQQAIVLWRGSKDDDLPEVPVLAGIEGIKIIDSGHKSPGICLSSLEDVLATYPEGGVVLALVGMSNGLGPTLAARTSWPVIGVAITAGNHPEDVWSNLRMPRQVPMVTVLSPTNAVLAALNILAQKNPVAYMHRQYAIEKLDK